MTIGGDAATRPATVVTTTVPAVEALCFARDLGGSLTHVIVAAAGRALGASPEVREEIGGPEGSDGIGIMIPAARGLHAVPVVRGAARDPLPRLRVVIDDVLDEAREGRLTSSGEHAAITILEHGAVPGLGDAAPGAPCVLEVGPPEGDPLVFELRLHVDHRTLDPLRADELLSRIASLLERPYRRLM